MVIKQRHIGPALLIALYVLVFLILGGFVTRDLVDANKVRFSNDHAVSNAAWILKQEIFAAQKRQQLEYMQAEIERLQLSVQELGKHQEECYCANDVLRMWIEQDMKSRKVWREHERSADPSR